MIIGLDPGPGRTDPVTRWSMILVVAFLALTIAAQIGMAVGWIPAGWRP